MRGRGALVIAAVALLLPAAAASAGTVTQQGATISYDGSADPSGQGVDLGNDSGTPFVTVDTGVTSPDCTANGPMRVDCGAASLFVARLSGFNDTLSTSQLGGLPIAVQARGGAGGDYLNGTNLADLLLGEDGDDNVYAYGGDDTLDGGPGADGLEDGPGNDLVSGSFDSDTWIAGTGRDAFAGGPGADDRADYSARVGAVTVTLDGVADDGEAGEGDNVATDVEEAIGGAGPDRLVGTADANLLRGGDGNDTLLAGPGGDRVEGEGGDDVIDTRDGGYDSVDCGSGNDVVLADPGDGTVGCEAAPDPDGDGYIDDDCDQGNALIHPGAGEVAGNALDEDCRNGPFYLRVVSLVQYVGSRRKAPLRAGFKVLRATDVRAGDRIEVRCKGRGCPFKRRTVKVGKARSRLSLAGLFKRRYLRPGATVEVRVLRPNEVGKVVRVKVGRRAALTGKSYCMPVGGAKPVSCSTLPQS